MSENCLCAVDLDSYIAGSSVYLHPVISTNRITLIVVRSSRLGLPILTGFGRCGFIVFHWESVSSVNLIEILQTDRSVRCQYFTK